jgi:hypothetical protein
VATRWREHARPAALGMNRKLGRSLALLTDLEPDGDDSVIRENALPALEAPIGVMLKHASIGVRNGQMDLQNTCGTFREIRVIRENAS